jgi:hypothetical protein
VRRSALLHSFSTNDASLGEYKYTVTVGNQSIKITGTNLDLVRVGMWQIEDQQQWVKICLFISNPKLQSGNPVLCQHNTVHICIISFSRVQFNLLFIQTSPRWSCPLNFSDQRFTSSSCFTCAYFMSHHDSFHAESSAIWMDVVEPVDCIKWYSSKISATFVLHFLWNGCKNYKSCIFWHAATIKNYYNLCSIQAIALCRHVRS